MSAAVIWRFRYIRSYYGYNLSSLKWKSPQFLTFSSPGLTELQSLIYRRITTFSKRSNFSSRDTCQKLKQIGIYRSASITMSTSDFKAKVVTLPEDVKSVKDKYLKLELDEKRSLYRCGDKYVMLKDIVNWEEYYSKEKVSKVEVEDGKYEKSSELNSKVSLWQGDITALEIDAIVNAANSSLMGGGGVDGAIHRAAGRDLLRESRELNGCRAGEAKITGGYKLPSKHVIHTVGPQEETPEILLGCYVNSLNLMLENQLRTIAFPCIGTGIYGFPRLHAAHIALKTVRKFLEKNTEKVDRIIFTVFLDQDKEVYEKLMQQYFPPQ